MIIYVCTIIIYHNRGTSRCDFYRRLCHGEAQEAQAFPHRQAPGSLAAPSCAMVLDTARDSP